MPTLGVTVQSRLAPPSEGAPTQTETAFVPVIASAGAVNTPTLLRSIADFESFTGARAAGNQVAYDWLDTFFREGGRRAYVSRYTGTGSTIDTALDSFNVQLGPGQVAAPNETPGAATYGKLLDHAFARNRFALLDVANGDTVAQMTTAGGAIPVSNQEYGALFAPWVTVPAPAGTVGGSVRQVHASAVIAALCARVDSLGNPNRAAAGRDFPLQYANGFVLAVMPTDTERNTLLGVGVNLFANVYGVLENYGFQTKLAQNADNPYWQANCGRARMWLKAKSFAVGENYAFKPIDGRGRLQRALQMDLEGVCSDLWQVDGLYGNTKEEAYNVNTSVSVNPVSTIAQGELHASVEVRYSLHAKSVVIDLVTVPLTGKISGQPS